MSTNTKPRIHSREWFLEQIAEAKKEIAAWPPSMQANRNTAVAALPKLPSELPTKAPRAAGPRPR